MVIIASRMILEFLSFLIFFFGLIPSLVTGYGCGRVQLDEKIEPIKSHWLTVSRSMS